MLTWSLSIMQNPNNLRSYYGHNALLRSHLKSTGKLRPPGEADISYVQFGLPHVKGILRTVYQSVTILSHYLGLPDRSREYKAARNSIGRADMVIVHSGVHMNGFEVIGADQSLMRIVRPAPMIPFLDRSSGFLGRPSVVGFAGRMDNFKRHWIASRSAAEAGVKFSFARDILFKDMAAWYDGIGILAMPSLAESWGLVASEALARGVPVVCTSAAGASEEIMETGAGIVVDSVGQDDFAGAVCRVIRDKSYAERAWVATPTKPITWLRNLIATCEEGLEGGFTWKQ
ncbi:MAG: glycosyltransferase [Aliifodinibius sp.]|nr:glycosyltransferase family 4 protein [Fodinibius sp.]NIY27237.1 glycosyltransferase [Fodinibius sp.]